MSDQPVIAILDVLRVGPQTSEESKVGEVEYHADGRLAILAVDPDHDGALRAALAAVNGKEQIVELAPPATGERSVGSKVTKRGEDGFLGALSGYLRRYYGYSLV